MNTQTQPDTISLPRSTVPDYSAFWGAFKPAATAVLQGVARSVDALYQGNTSHTIADDDSCDEFSVILTHQIHGETACELSLILKDATLSSEDNGVGVGIELFDHREQFLRIDGVVGNFTAAAVKLTTTDLEDCVSGLDMPHLINSVLAALRRQPTPGG